MVLREVKIGVRISFPKVILLFPLTLGCIFIETIFLFLFFLISIAGLRAVGFSTIASLVMALVINGALSYPSLPVS